MSKFSMSTNDVQSVKDHPLSGRSRKSDHAASNTGTLPTGLGPENRATAAVATS